LHKHNTSVYNIKRYVRMRSLESQTEYCANGISYMLAQIPKQKTYLREKLVVDNTKLHGTKLH